MVPTSGVPPHPSAIPLQISAAPGYIVLSASLQSSVARSPSDTSVVTGQMRVTAGTCCTTTFVGVAAPTVSKITVLSFEAPLYVTIPFRFASAL